MDQLVHRRRHDCRDDGVDDQQGKGEGREAIVGVHVVERGQPDVKARCVEAGGDCEEDPDGGL